MISEMISEILNDLRNYARINVKPGEGGGGVQAGVGICVCDPKFL